MFFPFGAKTEKEMSPVMEMFFEVTELKGGYHACKSCGATELNSKRCL